MENQSENIPNLDQVTQEEVKIVKTDVNAKDGQNKCPKCGATEISLNANNGKLRCHYCRYEFEPEKLAGKEQDISKLQGQVVGHIRVLFPDFLDFFNRCHVSHRAVGMQIREQYFFARV